MRYDLAPCPPHHLTFATTSARNPSWQDYLNNSRTLLFVGNVLFIVGDTFSATAMALQLRKFKSWAHALAPGRVRRIDILLNRLLIFAVATGAVTSYVLPDPHVRD